VGAPPSESGSRSPGDIGGQSALVTLPLLLVGVLLAWWGWKSGAYFGVVFLPGLMVLLALTAALLVFAPWPGRLTRSPRVALFALLGLAAWTATSALWSPTPAVAVSDSERVLAYGIAFALGIWLCLLLGRRMKLALAPVAGAAGVVAVASLIALWVGDNAADFFEENAALRYPLGYRNAEAAFFLIAVFPMLTLAAARELDWRARGALLGAATLSIELAVLSQSRGAAFAAVVGIAVLIAVHPARLRVVGYLALATLPAALALPWLLDLLQSDAGDGPGTIPPLHSACAAMAASSGAGALVGLVVARRDPTLSVGAARLIGRGLLALLGVVLLFGVIALARADRGPVGLAGDQIDEITAGTPDLSQQGSQLGGGLRSDRGDLWRVAIDDFEADPARGEGGGGFRSSYLLARDPEATEVQPEDPHSVGLLMASELGLPGVLLFAAFVIAAVVGALRSRRLGPSAAALSAAALAAGAYWLVHASFEWFWHYPAVTLPVVLLVGAAAAPACLRPAGPRRLVPRLALVMGAIGLVVALAPFFVSERYTKDALHTWRHDLTRAYSKLDDAADLDPLSEKPLEAEAVIAESAGEPQHALAALSEAQDRNPTEWSLYYLQARVLAPTDPVGARDALARALELNPYGPEILELGRQLNSGAN
jgi:O-Antigen ligase